MKIMNIIVTIVIIVIIDIIARLLNSCWIRLSPRMSIISSSPPKSPNKNWKTP